MRITTRTLSIVIALCWVATATIALPGAVVTDLFERDMVSFGLTVPDWDGYMANPAIKFMITPPLRAALPVRVRLSTADPMLYFDLPSEVRADGARKELIFNDRQPQAVDIAVFPSRNKQNEERGLAIQLIDGRGQRLQLLVPVHIVPVESNDHSPTFPITVDFSEDRTGFYRDESHRAVFEQAVRDWEFYLQDIPLDRVEAGREKTAIYEPNGFTKSDIVINPQGYRGFLLYAYGIDGPDLRSGGEPSGVGGFQRDSNGRTPIRRSGGMETEILGNYNKLGWLSPLVADRQWWVATNLQNVPNDLYSILHHEIGHTLFFNPANRNFHRNAVLKDMAVRAYLGSDVKTDLRDHFDGFVDPVSLHGAFGNEYHGKTPGGRWLITKLDLLCAQAIGYKLRPVAPLLPLAIRTESLPNTAREHWYSQSIAVEGGVPVYDWQIESGNWPPGFNLNRFTGQITGAASRAGDFVFTIRVRDYDDRSSGIEHQYEIRVTE
jgi:hypothetical protein